MSGGTFDHREGCIRDIISRIQEEIYHALKPRPQKVKTSYISVGEKRLPNCTLYDGRYWEFFKDLDEAKRYFAAKGFTITETEKGFDAYDNASDITYVVKHCITEIYPDGEYHPEYSDKTIEEMRNAIRTLDAAYTYAKSLDKLIAGDDDEDDLHRKLKDINKSDIQIFGFSDGDTLLVDGKQKKVKSSFLFDDDIYEITFEGEEEPTCLANDEIIVVPYEYIEEE